MGKVYVGEFGFDNLKEAQEYAKKVKEDPSYVPPVKTAQEFFDSIPPMTEEELTDHKAGEKQAGEELQKEINDGFVPHFDPQEPGQEPDDTQDSEATQESDAASSEALPAESNTVVVETGLEFETKEIDPKSEEILAEIEKNKLKVDESTVEVNDVSIVTEDDVPSDVELVNDHELPSDVEQDILDEAANEESDN